MSEGLRDDSKKVINGLAGTVSAFVAIEHRHDTYTKEMTKMLVRLEKEINDTFTTLGLPSVAKVRKLHDVLQRGDAKDLADEVENIVREARK